MKAKRTSWLVFYRTKNGKLSSMEIDADTGITKQEATDIVMEKKHLNSVYPDGKSCIEWGDSGPIVKKLEYV